MKPTFLIIGAMKSATTSLCAMLERHPDVFMCLPKEPEFFCKDAVYRRGMGWYESLFAAGASRAARGEGCTSYTKLLQYPNAADRIAADLPDVKLIYIVRHPLERLCSHWMHDRLNGKIPAGESFSESLRRRPEMIDASLYWRQMCPYRARFGDDQILVLLYDEFSRDPAAVASRCLEFLGLNDAPLPAANGERRNVSSHRLSDNLLLRTVKRTQAGSDFVFRFKHSLPGPLRNRVTRLFKRYRAIKPPVWTESSWSLAAEQIEPDSRQFLRENGPPDVVWTFSYSEHHARRDEPPCHLP